jgi:signal transduction histidine kinase
MKLFVKIILFLILPVLSCAQQYPYYYQPVQKQFDSLQTVLKSATNDTIRMAVYRDLSRYYGEFKKDSALYFNEQQLLLAKKLGLKLWEADALDVAGYMLWNLGNYPRSLQYLLQGIKIAEDPETEKNIWRISKFTKQQEPRIARLTVLGASHYDLGMLYDTTGYVQQKLFHYSEAEKIGKEINDQALLSLVYMNLGTSYLNRNELDSALSFLQRALACSEKAEFGVYRGYILNEIGRTYLLKENDTLAKEYFSKSILSNIEQSNLNDLADSYLSLADFFIKTSNEDSSLYYVKKGLKLYQATGDRKGVITAYNFLFSIYTLRNNIDSAFKYQGLAMASKDSLNDAEKIKQFQNIGFDEQLRLQQLEEEKAAFQNRVKIFAMLTGLSVFLLIALILYRNNRQKQKTNLILEKTLSNLKSTQAQLIQQEKMASLGELTAGIAHEIQNPLNFVNNFSEVNKELLVEMKDEMSKGNIDDANAIANDVIDNEEKIIHHGKRADTIVKGMLQHSRASTGKKEPTDINALCDEYLRLSYHGMRAKDKSFNATIKTDFDTSIGKINIVPQDIGRVLLNLFNNSFYACTERSRSAVMQKNASTSSAGQSYEPTVSVYTKKIDGKVEIHVKDNGTGIPQNIVDKIFQPFFTTKPTGQGTGLGLSLSYDIIKAHGGKIKVESKEGEGSEFIIQIPIN